MWIYISEVWEQTFDRACLRMSFWLTSGPVGSSWVTLESFRSVFHIISYSDAYYVKQQKIIWEYYHAIPNICLFICIYLILPESIYSNVFSDALLPLIRGSLGKNCRKSFFGEVAAQVC